MTENQINLKTLQRVDSNIVEIIDNASQVAIYRYNRELQKWESTDVEGALFLYRRSVNPPHGFIIVNRTNTTNFVETITGDMQLQLQEPYFLYKNHAGEIIGSWFYESKDLVRISQKIQGIVLKAAPPAPRRTRCASESERPSKGAANILGLLTEVHCDYPNDSKDLEKDDRLDNSTKKQPLDHSRAQQRLAPAAFRRSVSHVEASPRRRFMSAFDTQRPKFDFFMGEPLSKIRDFEFNDINKRFGAIVPPRKSFLSRQFELNGGGKIDKDFHQSCLKESLHSHLKNNPEVMFQIHEAYISSLRSLFAKK